MKTDTSIKLLTPVRMLLLFILLSKSKPVLGILSSFQGHGVRCLDRESLALLKFKNGLKNPDQTLHTWGNEDHKKDCCKWKGVLCHNRTNHVVELNLRDIESTGGNISEALGNLVSLSYLDLSGQNFQGSIPNTLGNLTFLYHLDLSDIRLEGGIPDSLGNLMHLSHLDLSYNQLEAGIPLTFGNLTSLSILDMSDNDHNREGWIIPEAVGNLESLSLLDVSRTKLEGRIPDALGNLTFLVHLDLSSNNLKGRIPDALRNLTSLVHLDLSSNNLKGRISDSLGNLRSLSNLRLSDNMLEGDVPHSLGELTFLSDLVLSHNKLQGWIPHNFGNLGSLFQLDLSYNNLDGGIPVSLGNLTTLTILDLSANMLDGRIPESLGNIAFLFELDLSYNNLDGRIPGSLGNLVYLYELDLSANILEATFDIRNNCPNTIWAAAVPGGGMQLNSGETWTINVAAGTTAARIWGRTGCSFNSAGRGSCQTGDCGGLLQCRGYGAPPNTLAEYALNQFNNLDFFDISLVDGFNLPMEFVPTSGGCTGGPRCTADVNGQCPAVLQATGGCNNPCTVFKTDQYCCNSGSCSPTDYSRYFKDKCPDAYSYPKDDASSTFTCPGGTNYRVVFCP